MPTITPSNVQLIVNIFAIAGGLYAALRVFGLFLLWLRGPDIRLYIADRVWPVGHTGERNIVIQLHFSLYNKGRRVGVLQRLEVTLLTPEHSRYNLPWEIFLDPRPDGVVPKSPVFPVPLNPKEFALQAVQCRGIIQELNDVFDWPMGPYALDIAAWINGRRKVLSPTGGFRFQVDGLAWGMLSHQLNQPPNPIAHPVAVINWSE
jgi:hypothetical protein